jgi:hypothetical protein
MVTEEICGRFGSFDGSTVHIGSLADWGNLASDDERVSFTVWTAFGF